MTKLLIITPRWPEANSSAAGRHLFDIVSAFRATFPDLVVKWVSPALSTDYSDQLEDEILHFLPNETPFDDWVSNWHPDVVIFDRFMVEEQFGWRVAKHCPNAIRILETQDLHSVREARHTALKRNKMESITGWQEIWMESDLLIRELAAINRSDLSLIISEFEFQLLADHGVDKRLLQYFPFLVDDQEFAPIDQHALQNRNRSAITIGNFLHAPNWDSIQYLYKTIWPRIIARDNQLDMHVFGAYMPEHAKQLDRPGKRFYMHGRAEDALQVLSESKLLLAPLRFGAGLKGKILEAVMSGTPVITTTIGAEGMFDQPNANLHRELGHLESRHLESALFAKTEDEFVEMAITYLTNPSKHLELITAQQQELKKRLSRTRHVDALADAVSNIKQDVKTHRTRNLVGRMLNHQSLRSTEYMSRWIASKNKVNELTFFIDQNKADTIN